MGLFDAFSDSSGKAYARQGYRSMTAGLGDAQDKAYDARKDAIKAYQGGQTQSNEALESAYNTGRGDINTYYGQGYERLGENADKAAGYLQQGMAPYQGMYDRGEAGVDAYWNLLTNPNAYSLSPAAQWQMQQGLEALNRQAAGRGMLSSGNNTQDILDYSQGLADQDRRAELGMYNPYFNLYGQGASGLASGYQGLGGLYERLGQNQAGYLQSQGNALAGLAGHFGDATSNVAQGTAGRIGGAYEDYGRLAAELQARKGQAGYQLAADQFAAEQTANKNMWDAILGGVSGLAGAWANA